MKIYCILRKQKDEASMIAMVDDGNRVRQLDAISFTNPDEDLLRMMEWARDLISDISYEYIEDKPVEDAEENVGPDPVEEAVSTVRRAVLEELSAFRDRAQQAIDDMIDELVESVKESVEEAAG